MKSRLKKIKVITLIVIIIIILLVLARITITTLDGKLVKIRKSEYNSNSLEFDYDIVKIENGKAKILIKITDKVNGIKQIDYPNLNGDPLIMHNRKEPVGIDYSVELEKEYKFAITTGDGNQIEKIIKINNPIINCSEEESLTLNVEVEYPVLKGITVRNEYSINGIDYQEYVEGVLIKDNCTFYARVVNADTNEVLLSSQKNINNILYEWQVWNYTETSIYVPKTETRTMNTTFNYKMSFYSSYLETETGYRVTGNKSEYYRTDSRNN